VSEQTPETIIAKTLHEQGIAPGWHAGLARTIVAALREAGYALDERYEHQPDLWVYVGEDVYVEGIPFGGWQRKGEGYHASAPVREPSVPVFRRLP
jgi:hypothetical protein